MESGNKLKRFSSTQNKKIDQQSPLEASKLFDKHINFDWKYLLARIYQNINGPALKKKKSSKLLIDSENSLGSNSSNFKCNCKKTKCLKLYCECFAKGQYCNNCNCECCNNTSEYDSVRSTIIDEIIQKNPNAFDALERTKKTGCICKKTGCLKKYCQCFSANKKCGQQCKCANCENSA